MEFDNILNVYEVYIKDYIEGIQKSIGLFKDFEKAKEILHQTRDKIIQEKKEAIETELQDKNPMESYIEECKKEIELLSNNDYETWDTGWNEVPKIREREISE